MGGNTDPHGVINFASDISRDFFAFAGDGFALGLKPVVGKNRIITTETISCFVEIIKNLSFDYM